MNTRKNLINGMTVDELLAFHREQFGDARMEDDDALTAATATAEPTTVPTDFIDIDDAALGEMLEALTAEFDGQYGEGSRDIAALTALADDIDRIRGEQTARATAAAEADAAAEALAARIRPAVEAAENVEAIAAEAAGGDAVDPETPADPAPADPAPVDPVEPVAPEAVAPAAVVAASAARRAAPAAVANRALRPAPARNAAGGNRALVAGAAAPTAPRPSLVAALDFASSQYPDLNPNNEVTLLQISASMQERAASMPVGKNRPRIGRLNLPFAPERTMTSDPQHNSQVLRNFAEPTTAAALVAAGGWCAPSTPVFEMFDLGPDADNLFDVPTFGGDVRAGILFPSFFSIGDADDAFWSWSETADINAVGGVAFTGSITANVATIDTGANEHGLEVGNSVRLTGATASGMPDGDYVVATVVDANTFTVATDAANDVAITGTMTPFKHCMRIPCPTWSECRMGADGLCVTHGNLSNEAWPELTADFLRIALASHRRYMSSRRITRVVNDTVLVAPDALPSDVVGDYLAIIELQATDMRSQYRVGKNRVIEALIPEWLLPVMRANLAMRLGVENFLSVTDAQIIGWLTARGIKPQFTPDWQPLYAGAPATAYPATVTTAMWFGGSYFSLNGGRIDLGVQRDPEMNAYNDYTAAWFEEFWTICRRGPQGRRFTYTLTGKINDPMVRETAINA